MSDLKVKSGDLLTAEKWNAFALRLEKLSVQENGSLVINTTSSKLKSSLTVDPASNFTAQTQHGFLKFGPANTGWCHFHTDRNKFYFNKEIRVDSGKISSYKGTLSLCSEGNLKMSIHSNGDILIKEDTAKLSIPHKGKITLGPWEMRQTGGGSVTSYFYLDRRTTDATNNMFKVDWNGNIKARGWVQGSDLRTKKEVFPFKDGLAFINKMQPVSFKYNGLADSIKDQEDIGFIAQDLEKIAPYLVTRYSDFLNSTDETETELLNVRPLTLIYLLINAVKELHAQLKK